jgi:hypothetical protein
MYDNRGWCSLCRVSIVFSQALGHTLSALKTKIQKKIGGALTAAISTANGRSLNNGGKGFRAYVASSVEMVEGVLAVARELYPP